MLDTDSTPPLTLAATPIRPRPRIDVSTLRAAVHATDYALALSGVHVPANVRIRWKAGFTTAAWRYTPPHVITIGDRLLVRATAATCADPIRIHGYVQSYYEHELAHACHTVSDLDAIVRELGRVLGMPTADPVEPCEVSGARHQQIAPWLVGAFRLLNVFEDARIEHRWRSETRRGFGWTVYEQSPPTPAASALACFERRIQTEGALPAIPGVDQAVADRYYAACCAAPDTWAIVTLVAQWWHEVGPYVESMDTEQSTDWKQDLLVALALHLGCLVPSEPGATTSAAQWESEACAIAMPEGDPGEVGRPSGQPIAVDAAGRDDAEATLCTSAVQLASYPTEIPTTAIDRLTDRLIRVLGRHQHTMTSWSPSRRVSARATLTGRAPFRHTVVGKGRSLSVALYVDCSGSMDGHHMDEARILIAGLSRLARTHYVTGDVILTATEEGEACQTVLPLPVAEDTIGRIVAYANGEGLEAALHATAARVCHRDLILVYSDGEITDAPIDKIALKARGVAPIGCYVGDAHQAERLARWFSPVLVAPTAEILADLIVRERRRV